MVPAYTMALHRFAYMFPFGTLTLSLVMHRRSASHYNVHRSQGRRGNCGEQGLLLSHPKDPGTRDVPSVLHQKNLCSRSIFADTFLSKGKIEYVYPQVR